jgi:transposase
MSAQDVGRPTKCSPELTARVCSYVRQGNYVEIAAAAAGVNKSTLYDWLKRGAREAALRGREDGEVPPQRQSKKRARELAQRAERREREEPYLGFSDAVEKAMAEAEVTLSLRLAKAGGDGQWRADAFRLERLFPTRWGRRLTRLDPDDPGATGMGADEEVDDLSNLSDADLDDIERILERGARGA